MEVDIEWNDLRAKIDFTDLYDKFQKKSTITYNCFSWIWEDKELADIVNEAFDMYNYHT
jgi:hypothetical protein